MKASIVYWRAREQMTHRLNIAEENGDTKLSQQMFDQAFGICTAFATVLDMMSSKVSQHYHDKLLNDWDNEYRKRFIDLIYKFD